MITTNTGAKKLESSDNWREIFPNPGTGAAGAHNASVDAQDRIQAEVAPIINGKQCAVGASAGEYVLLRNSTISGKTDGAYQATKAIPANTDLDSTYLGSPITGGIVNELNGNITTLSNTVTQKQDKLTRPLCSSDVIQYGPFAATAGQPQPLITASTYVPSGKKFAGVQKVFFAGANDVDPAGALEWSNDGVVWAVPTKSQPNVYVRLVVLYY